MPHRNALMQQLAGHVRHGDHLCVVCDDPAERFDAIVQYIADGLRQNEFVMYAADGEVTGQVCDALERMGIDVGEARRRGALNLPTADDAYLVDGRFDADRMYATFEHTIESALASGFSGCRFGGEPLWALGNPDLREALIAFEGSLNALFCKHKAAGLCVYDGREWPPEVVRDVLRTHPIAVVGDVVCKRNPYYEPRPMPDAAAQVSWMLGELRESRAQDARIEVALEAGRLGSWELDLTTDRAVRSPRHDAIFGYDHMCPQWGYDLFLQHVLPEDRPMVDARFRQAVEQRSTWQFECRIRRANDGAVRWIEAHGRTHPQPPPGGKAERLLGIVADITERKELEQAMRDADRRKDEFLATLAHELRNPLAPISNSLQLLRAGGADQPPLRRAREVIERQVRHLTRLVDDLLDVSRITTGRINLQRERVPLRNVLGNAIEASHPLIEASRHAFSVSLPSEPVYVHGDPTRLAQVFLNLLNNAAKYTPSGGRIEVEAACDGADVVVTVRDNGVGIAPERIPEMFRMFVQGHRSGERAQGGLGIGLPLSRQLLELHGGTIEARSEGPGRGSAFLVRLPRCEAPVADAGTGEQLRRHSRRRVLVVDDNVDAAETLAGVLEMVGHQTRTCYSGCAALAAARAQPPDVVILDIGLPDMDGYDVARQLRTEFGASITLIALTGWGQDRDRERAREAGFDHHRTKPVDTDELLRLMERALRTSEAPEPTAAVG